MSNEAIDFVLKFKLPGLAKYIAFLLANFANKQGISWRSIGSLSTLSGLSRATVIRQLKILEDVGLISRQRRSEGQTTVYKMDFSNAKVTLLPSLCETLGSITQTLPHSLPQTLGESPTDTRGSLPQSHKTKVQTKEKPKEEKKIEKERPARESELDGQAIEVLNFLNEKKKCRYGAIPANLKFIRGRLAEGRTVRECRQVIAYKFRKWEKESDKDMLQYINPHTLFRPGNFDRYLNEMIREAQNEQDKSTHMS